MKRGGFFIVFLVVGGIVFFVIKKGQAEGKVDALSARVQKLPILRERVTTRLTRFGARGMRR